MNKKYALITGASNGLGKCLAIECASRGMNLLLVSLPDSGLRKLASFIERRFGVHTVCLEKDLSEFSSCMSIYNDTRRLGITVSFLVNNAGMGGTFIFDSRTPEFYSKMISLNITAPTMLCRLFAEDLRSCRGHILNVGSLAGRIFIPRKQVYCGTKSYLYAFSDSLRQELEGEVSVSILCPGGMNTYWQLQIDNRLTGTWLSRKSIMEPSDVARIAVRKALKRRKVIIPGMLNRCFLFLHRTMHHSIRDFLIRYQNARTMERVNPSSMQTVGQAMLRKAV